MKLLYKHFFLKCVLYKKHDYCQNSDIYHGINREGYQPCLSPPFLALVFSQFRPGTLFFPSNLSHPLKPCFFFFLLNVNNRSLKIYYNRVTLLHFLIMNYLVIALKRCDFEIKTFFNISDFQNVTSWKAESWKAHYFVPKTGWGFGFKKTVSRLINFYLCDRFVNKEVVKTRVVVCMVACKFHKKTFQAHFRILKCEDVRLRVILLILD